MRTTLTSKLSLWIVLIAIQYNVVAGLLIAAPSPVQAAELNLVQYVDPLTGTGPSNSPNPVGGGSGGSTFPGPTAPFGMVQFSPDTPNGEPSGYKYQDTIIEGFSLTHFNGAGCSNYEDLPILPVVGPLHASPGTNWNDYTSSFSHSTETASAGYYGVRLDDHGIEVELTATTRTGFARLTYPASPEATLLLDVSHDANGSNDGAAQIVSDTEITGWVTSGDFCNSGQYFRIYFTAQFDRPFRSYGTWLGGTISPGLKSTQGSPAGVYVTFDTTQSSVVQVKIGLSYVSVANAQQNLAIENPSWDFNAVRNQTRETWNTVLNRIQVQGGSTDQLKQFYTALYHVLMNPAVFNDVNGQYIGFDDQVHTADGYTHYANFSGWDIYRSWIQLMAVIAPQESIDIIKSMLADAQQGGALPKWSQANRETGVMVGDPGAIIVSSAYAFGVRNFDTAAALQFMDKAGRDPNTNIQWRYIRPGLKEYLSHHYVPIGTGGVWGPAATTLEYTSADFAVAQFAQALGDTSIYNEYMRRAQYWQNLFNPVSDYIHPRYGDGAWLSALDPAAQSEFVEGNAAQYTWMIPYNLQTLFDRMGGNDNAIQRIDHLFTELNAGISQPYFYIGNEPQFATPWAYTFAGTPWKTQETVRRVLTESFNSSPGGLPGNDDLGATSSWYIWAALGLYPAIPGTDVLVLHGPLFPSVTIHLGNGRTIQIDGTGAATDAPYIQSAQINGSRTTRTWLSFSEIANGATFQFTMGSAPNTAWGSDPADSPPSYTDGVPGLNLALNKPATADSSCASSENPSKAVDGTVNNNSKWCSLGSNKWLQIDLSQRAEINSFTLKHAGAGGESSGWNTRDFNIQLSTDGTNWTTVVDVAGNTSDMTSHAVDPTIARYVRLNVTVPTNTGDNAARIYELEVYGSFVPLPKENLALNRPATADSSCAVTERPDKAVDETLQHNSKWCSLGSTKWLQIDLGSNQEVETFVLKHAGFAGERTEWNTRDFTIQVSADGANWTTVVEELGNNASRTIHTVAPLTARYVRLNVTVPTSTSDPAARIYELEVYGPSTQPPQENLALNKPATADSSCLPSEGAEKAVDGSVTNNSKWCSKGATQWLQIDLGKEAQISSVTIKHAGAGGETSWWNTRDFTIQLSPDGTSWTTVVNVTGNTSDVTSHTIAPTIARYVRLNVIVPTNTSDTAARIYELEVYGRPTP